jgi:predicted transcriptional regulator
MYTVFLLYAKLQENVLVLVEDGLIEQCQKELQEDEVKENKDKGKQRSSNYYYRITDKGRHFFQIYRDLSEMIMIA